VCDPEVYRAGSRQGGRQGLHAYAVKRWFALRQGTAIVVAINTTLLTLRTELGAPIQTALQRWRKTSVSFSGLRQTMPFQHSVDVLDLVRIQLWAQLLSMDTMATHGTLTSSMSRSSKAI